MTPYAVASKVDRAFDPTTEREAVAALDVDVVIECAGSEQRTRMGIAALRPQGTMVVVGGGVHAGLDPMAIVPIDDAPWASSSSVRPRR